MRPLGSVDRHPGSSCHYLCRPFARRMRYRISLLPKTSMKIPILLTLALLTGCAVQPKHAASVSTATLADHISTAQQGVSVAQSTLSANDGKSVVIRQWLNQN